MKESNSKKTEQNKIKDECFKQTEWGNIIGFGRRFVLMAIDNLGEERKRFTELIGEQATEAILYSSGKRAGMQASEKMRKIFMNNLDSSVKTTNDDRVDSNLEVAVKHLNLADDMGWGYVNYYAVSKDKLEGEIIDCWEAEAYLSAYGKKSEFPVCHFTRGFGAGLASAYLKKDMEAIELECLAMGHKKCKMLILTKEAFEKIKK